MFLDRTFFPIPPLSVLVVDDEPIVLDAVQSILASAGYHVLGAPSGVEALHLFQQKNGAIRLLLTDVLMPGMNGLELARQLLHLNPHLKCVLMSGYDAGELRRRGTCRLEYELLRKPFVASALLEVIERVLAPPA